MSERPNVYRSMEAVLSELRAKHDRMPENSISIRQDLSRMADLLEAEIVERNARRRSTMVQ